ncbi:MAG: nucleotidyl transferase AbiEii/AbiGii toxin family protein [bacterium]
MIEKNEIDIKSDELGVHVANVQRDYIFGWLLSGLYQPDNPLSNELILKGGNCFRKAYFENARFSNYLDFSTQTELDEERLRAAIEHACKFAMKRSGVEFLVDQNRIGIRDSIQEDSVFYDARVYFKSFYGDEDITIKVELDVKEYDKILLPVQTRDLIHSYSDNELCKASIRCWKLEELLAAKLKALLQRRHSPDLYDFVFAIFFQKFLHISRLEVISAFLKKTIYEPNPEIAKGLLIELPFQLIRGLWNEFLVCPKPSLISFDDAEIWFRTIITELFGLLKPRPAFAPTGVSVSPSYFRAINRNTIFEAGRLQKLLSIVYNGVERMVEPYSLVFKRPKVGVPHEYFYAWDRSGGRSGHIGIKSFISEKIQSIQMTEKSFEPRFPIELVKGPGYFAKPFSSSPQPRRTPDSRRTPSYSSGITYTIECPICGKKFKRNKFDTRLNEHKDKYGNRCYGRIGTIV